MFLSTWRNRKYKQVMTERLGALQSTQAVPDGGSTQELFNRSMFTLMGRLAKMDGQVIPREIEYANAVMGLMGLDVGQRKQAIAYFGEGKQKGTDVRRLFTQLAQSIGRRSQLSLQFLQIQCRLACIKGALNLQEKALLKHLSDALGFERQEFEKICARMQTLAGKKPSNPEQKKHWELAKAYDVLGVSHEDGDPNIRRAYLRLVHRFHPDKYLAKSATPGEIEWASKKMQEVKSAYELISRQRKMS